MQSLPYTHTGHAFGVWKLSRVACHRVATNTFAPPSRISHPLHGSGPDKTTQHLLKRLGLWTWHGAVQLTSSEPSLELQQRLFALSKKSLLEVYLGVQKGLRVSHLPCPGCRTCHTPDV